MEELIGRIKFDEKGLVPAVIQEANTGKVLMVAYMNREALKETVRTGYTHYFSRSRKTLWRKGETSGHVQEVVSISPDCDSDTLLIRVNQKGAACHTGHYSCFFTEYDTSGNAETDKKVFDPGKVYGKSPAILQELFDVIKDRRDNPREGSYTCYLFEKGLDKMLKKVGEESAEVIIASKNDSKDELVYEIADLVYHLFVMMVERGLTPGDVYEELKKRR